MNRNLLVSMDAWQKIVLLDLKINPGTWEVIDSELHGTMGHIGLLIISNSINFPIGNYPFLKNNATFQHPNSVT